MAAPRLRQLDDRRSELVVAFYPMVQRIARRTWSRLPRGVDLQDLVGAGVIGLVEAVERFDPARGITFEVYAKYRVQGAILDALRATDWVPRAVRMRAGALQAARRELTAALGRPPHSRELAERLGLPLEAIHGMEADADARQPASLDAAADEGGPTHLERLADPDDPERRYARTEAQRSVVQATLQLPEREKLAIEWFYFQDRSLKEIGSELGVTESRVSQLCSQAIKRLKTALASAEVA